MNAHQLIFFNLGLLDTIYISNNEIWPSNLYFNQIQQSFECFTKRNRSLDNSFILRTLLHNENYTYYHHISKYCL